MSNFEMWAGPKSYDIKQLKIEVDLPVAELLEKALVKFDSSSLTDAEYSVFIAFRNNLHYTIKEMK